MSISLLSLNYICYCVFTNLQVMGLLQVVVNNAVARIDSFSRPEPAEGNSELQATSEAPSASQKDSLSLEQQPNQEINPCASSEVAANKSITPYDILLQLPKPDLRNLCTILAHEGYLFSN